MELVQNEEIWPEQVKDKTPTVNKASLIFDKMDIILQPQEGSVIQNIYYMILSMIAGHFTQLVWSVSRRLGVGIAR